MHLALSFQNIFFCCTDNLFYLFVMCVVYSLKSLFIKILKATIFIRSELYQRKTYQKVLKTNSYLLLQCKTRAFFVSSQPDYEKAFFIHIYD